MRQHILYTKIYQIEAHLIIFTCNFKNKLSGTSLSMTSSKCSSSVAPNSVLDSIFAVSCETEIPKAFKIFFQQQIDHEKGFTNDIRNKIANVNASITMLSTAIREMESRSDKAAWMDAIYCFKQNKDRLDLKLSRLTQLEDDNLNGVTHLQVQ